MIGASALAFSLATPGVALASGECGPPNAAADPNLASCIGDPNEYANGITYNQGSYATPAGILIDLYSTITVAPTTNGTARSEEHTSELQSLMRISYAVFSWKKKIKNATDRV